MLALAVMMTHRGGHHRQSILTLGAIMALWLMTRHRAWRGWLAILQLKGGPHRSVKLTVTFISSSTGSPLRRVGSNCH